MCDKSNEFYEDLAINDYLFDSQMMMFLFE